MASLAEAAIGTAIMIAAAESIGTIATETMGVVVTMTIEKTKKGDSRFSAVFDCRSAPIHRFGNDYCHRAFEYQHADDWRAPRRSPVLK